MLARPAIACGARRALPVGGREDASVSASNCTPAAVLRATADVAKLVWMRCLQPHPLLMALLGSAGSDRKVGLRMPRWVVHALRAHEPSAERVLARAVLWQAVAFANGQVGATRARDAAARSRDRRGDPFSEPLHLGGLPGSRFRGVS